MLIGETASGTVTVDGSSSLSGDDIYVGYDFPCELTVSGSNASLNVGDELLVGDGASGTVTINGATASIPYAYAGYDTQGTVTISGGSAVTLTETYVGYDGQGQFSISSGSTVTLGETYIGYDAQGELAISGGSVANSDYGYPGYDGDGIVSISGVGSVWNVSEEFHPGYDGAENAYMTFSDGGVLNATSSFTITGDADSTYTFEIGANGSGKINVPGSVDRAGGDTYFELAVDVGASVSPGDVFTLIDYGTWNGGTFQVSDGVGGYTTLMDGGTYTTSAASFMVDYDDDLGGGNLALTATVTAVPEPGSFLYFGLIGTVLGGYGWIRKRRQI